MSQQSRTKRWLFRSYGRSSNRRQEMLRALVIALLTSFTFASFGNAVTSLASLPSAFPLTTPSPSTIPTGDRIPPSILAFTVIPAITDSDVSIGWQVADTGGSHLKEIRIWRVADSDGTPVGDAWHELHPLRQSLPRGEDQIVGQASDSPPSGNWWYVIHAVDYDGNWSFWPNPIRVTKSGPDGIPGSFSDVLSNDWAFPYVEALYRSGFAKGCQEMPVRKYCPRDPLNRAEESVFILRAAQGADFIPRQPDTPPFDDVPVGFWAADWISQLKERGFTEGCTEDGSKFCPLHYNTIAEGAVFFIRILEGPDFVPPIPTRIPFLDLEPSDWYTPWMVYAFNAGLLAPCRIGSGGAYICPNIVLRRDLAAYMMAGAKGLSITDPIPTPTPTPASLTNPFGLQMFDDMNGWAVRKDPGGFFQLLRTREAGKTWHDVTPALGPGFTDWFFLDAQHAWLGVLDTGLGPLLWSTQDGGESWVVSGASVDRPPRPGDGWQQIEFTDSQFGWSILGLQSDNWEIGQFVFRTQDSGVSWTQVYSDPNSFIHSLDFVSSRIGWMTGHFEGTPDGWLSLQKTSDGGMTWSLMNIPLPDYEFDLVDLVCAATPYLFDDTSGALFIECLDWDSKYSDTKPSQYFLYRTDDGGQSWLKSSVPGSKIHFLGPEGAIASDWTHPAWLPPGAKPFVLYRTLDDGNTWEKVSELPWAGGEGYLRFIDIQRGWGFASFSSDHQDVLLRTSDGGQTWQELSPVIVP